MRLLYRRDAAADVAAAHAWYEAQRQGLGDEFLESLRHAEEAVLASPCTYRVIHRDTRRFLLRRFPSCCTAWLTRSWSSWPASTFADQPVAPRLDGDG